MADGIEELNVAKNCGRISASFKDNPSFSSVPAPHPMKFVDPRGSALDVSQNLAKIDAPTPTDPWVVRYPNSKMK